MSPLTQIQKGKSDAPPRLIVYGTEGIGKSTLGSQLPAPVFIQTEDGLNQIDADKFPKASSYENVIEQLDSLLSENHEYQAVVIDSLDRLELLIFDSICRSQNVSSIEEACKGYGKGYIYALNYWREILGKLDALKDTRSMIVMLIAHAKVEKFEDPENGAYDRYSPRLNKHACALVSEWTDALLFATRKMIVKNEDAGFGRVRTLASSLYENGSDRILKTVGGPACVAKNRFNLPAEIPLSWTAVINGMSPQS